MTNGDTKDRLLSFVERIELIHKEKKELGDDEKLICAEAKSEGFDVPTIKRIIQIRKTDPDKRKAANEVLDLYLHALGMAPDLPLFKSVESLLDSGDRLGPEKVLEAYMQLVPVNGEIIVRHPGLGHPVRLWRDLDGTARHEEFIDREPGEEPPPSRRGSRRKSAAAELPDDLREMSVSEAEALGTVSHGNGLRVLDNPFPAGDPRRGAWDRGWRKASGNSGMGED